MSVLTQVRLGLGLIGVVLFGYGVRTADVRLRWIGIGALAVSAALRFWPKERQPPA